MSEVRSVRIRTEKATLPYQIVVEDIETGIKIIPLSMDIKIRRDDIVTAVIEIPVSDIDMTATIVKWKLEGND